MIAHLRGLLLAATASYAIVDVGGVGYKVYIPVTAMGKLPALNGNCRLWIAHIVREQSEALYGFLEQRECELFEALIGINGVGPKLALNMLGHLGAMELLQAVDAGDVAVLSKVPGIGKKTAQRLIIEMRGKGADVSSPVMLLGGSGVMATPQRQAISALVNLGYSEAVAQKAVNKQLQTQPADSDVNLSGLIAAALQHV